MNFAKVYDSLIEKRKREIISEGYFERHHIVPKSMGGSNRKDNIVNLTAREHFVAHLLLYKIHRNRETLMAIRAFKMGANRHSRDYDWLRREFSRKHSEFMIEYNSKYGNPFLGKKHTTQTKLKISNSTLGRTAHNKGKENSSKSREKISASLKKAWAEDPDRWDFSNRSESHRKKLSASIKENYEKFGSKHSGMKRSEETKFKIRDAYRKNHPSRKVLKFDINGALVQEYDFLSDVEFNTSNVSKCLQGKIKHAYGFKWRYADEV